MFSSQSLPVYMSSVDARGVVRWVARGVALSVARGVALSVAHGVALSVTMWDPVAIFEGSHGGAEKYETMGHGVSNDGWITHVLSGGVQALWVGTVT